MPHSELIIPVCKEHLLGYTVGELISGALIPKLPPKASRPKNRSRIAGALMSENTQSVLVDRS